MTKTSRVAHLVSSYDGSCTPRTLHGYCASFLLSALCGPRRPSEALYTALIHTGRVAWLADPDGSPPARNLDGRLRQASLKLGS
jgi:hypothetical protein